MLSCCTETVPQNTHEDKSETRQKEKNFGCYAKISPLTLQFFCNKLSLCRNMVVVLSGIRYIFFKQRHEACLETIRIPLHAQSLFVNSSK